MAKSTVQKFKNDLKKEAMSQIDVKGFVDINEYIPTGNLILNAQMSGSLRGGVPDSRSVCFAGESGAGKTFVCLNIAREAQKMGYLVVYVDTEGALDESDFHRFDVDTSDEMLDYNRIGVLSELKFYINQLIEKKKEFDSETKEEDDESLKIMIIVDSINQLNSAKEKRDAYEGKEASDMGLNAKELKQFFKNVTLDLSNLRIPFIFTNHVYDGMGPYDSKKTSGGRGPEYAASITLMLSQKQIRDQSKENKDAGRTKTGIVVKSEIKKNRLVTPVDIHFHINFYKGYNPFVGLESYLSWDQCGIGRGLIKDEEEMQKYLRKKGDNIEYYSFNVDDEIKYFVPYKGSSYFCKDTGEQVPKDKVFSTSLFDAETVKKLDDNVIKPTFQYQNVNQVIKDEYGDVDQILNSNSEQESD
jgi:RecA/RadA recombinase